MYITIKKMFYQKSICKLWVWNNFENIKSQNEMLEKASKYM